VCCEGDRTEEAPAPQRCLARQLELTWPRSLRPSLCRLNDAPLYESPFGDCCGRHDVRLPLDLSVSHRRQLDH
jgi:hypothetical protein